MPTRIYLRFIILFIFYLTAEFIVSSSSTFSNVAGGITAIALAILFTLDMWGISIVKGIETKPLSLILEFAAVLSVEAVLVIRSIYWIVGVSNPSSPVFQYLLFSALICLALQFYFVFFKTLFNLPTNSENLREQDL